MGRRAFGGRGGPVEALRTGVSPEDMEAAIAAAVGTSEPASSTVAHTATADGTGTGQIAVGTDLAQVTSANANHIMTLPDAPVNAVVTLRNGATGYELRSHDPATVGINGGTGAAAESAIPANTRTICHHDTATTWICHDTTTAGVVSASEVASP